MLKRNQIIARRIERLQREVKLNTQQLRFNIVSRLSELFKFAADMARSQKTDLNERQKWMRVAAYIAQVIEGVSKGFDERQINVYIDELQRLVDEARAEAAAGEAEEGTPGTERKDTASQESH